MGVEFEYVTELGDKAENQDVCRIQQFPWGTICAVFDGHGRNGFHVAHFASKQLMKYLDEIITEVLKSNKPLIEDETTLLNKLIEGIQNAFERTSKDVDNGVVAVSKDDDGKSSESTQNHLDIHLSGTTACIIGVVEGKVSDVENETEKFLFSGSLGDTKAVLCVTGKDNHWKAVTLTTDHICSNEEERKRVEEKGGNIRRIRTLNNDSQELEHEQGPLRLYNGTLPYPGLVVTRAFGDLDGRSIGVISVPEIDFYKLTTNDHAIIVASDGLWDSITPKVAAKMLTNFTSPKEAAEKLKNFAIERSRHDNVTVAVLKLIHSEEPKEVPKEEPKEEIKEEVKEEEVKEEIKEEIVKEEVREESKEEPSTPKVFQNFRQSFLFVDDDEEEDDVDEYDPRKK